MFAVQRQTVKSRERKSGERALGRAYASAQPKLAVQRASCACGGGCPRCRENYPLQAKLAVSQPGDTLEREADRVAEQVLRMPQPELPDNPEAHESSGLRLSRYASGRSTQSSPEVPPIVHNVVRSPGEPLDPATRAFMEPRFGYDFSQVRVHTDARAAESARAVNALAYTVGQNVVFGAGRYSPGTASGKPLIAHELTHVVQQSRGLQRSRGEFGIVSQADASKPVADQAAQSVVDGGIATTREITGACLSRQTPTGSVTASPTPASTGATVSGCTKGPTGQEGAIRSGISSAITTWLPAATKALGASPLAPDTIALLDKHFKTHVPANVSVILDNFKKMQSNVDASSTEYECANWNLLCAVGSAFTYCGSDTTHICSDAFDYGAMQMTRLVIHERGHGARLCGDVYCDLQEVKYKKLSSKDAMNNADTYAAFAGEISGKFLC